MDALFTEIYATFKREENEEVAKGMKAYMRGQFDYLGLSSPIRKHCLSQL